MSIGCRTLRGCDDAWHPFIVETYALAARSPGNQFNMMDEPQNGFSFDRLVLETAESSFIFVSRCKHSVGAVDADRAKTDEKRTTGFSVGRFIGLLRRFAGGMQYFGSQLVTRMWRKGVRSGEIFVGKRGKSKNSICFPSFYSTFAPHANAKRVMIQRDHIIDQAMEMFATQGIKAVRMDDIARSLGVSKRTLYEQFGDKQGLLLLAMNRYFERIQQRYAEMTAAARNVLEEMFMVLGEVMASSEVTNRMAANLKKFYPEVHDKLTEAYLCKRTEELRLRLEKGIADGFFVRGINIELAISVLYYTASALVVRRDLIIPKGMSEREAFVQIVSNFFRGISTARGLELIDDYLTRYHLSSNNEENKQI